LAVAAILAAPLLSHAGASSLQATYRQMASIQNTMEQDAGRQSLSNTYSGKLSTNLAQLKDALDQGSRLSTRLPVGRGQTTSADSTALLIEVASFAAETDAFDNFSESARRSLRDQLGEIEETIQDQDLLEKVSDALDALDISLGEDTVSAPIVAERGAMQRTWKQRHHGKHYADRKSGRYKGGYSRKQRNGGYQSGQQNQGGGEKRQLSKKEINALKNTPEAQAKRAERAAKKLAATNTVAPTAAPVVPAKMRDIDALKNSPEAQAKRAERAAKKAAVEAAKVASTAPAA